MLLGAGVRLGVYEVVSHIGSGGMGEVYRARDTKLGRDVALKILPESLTHDPERVGRFRREAQVLASLNHPNIGAIHGLEDAGGSQFLVLELVEGENLAAHLERGPIPVGEALAIARQIAAALEAAHEKGLVHRDLKPANIALTADGQAKVLDFGLAKAIVDDASSVNPSGLSHSPTLTFAATQMGVILGTAAYMSPEQAKGLAADNRSDIWAFGCVLFEMLAGKRPFAGEDVSDTLAAVLRGDPDWDALPNTLPPSIVLLLRRSLEKDRRRRVGDISTATFLLDQPLDALPAAVPSGAVAALSPGRTWAAASVAGALITAGALAAVAAWRAVPSASPIVTRFRLPLGDGQQFTNTTGQAIAISNDGSKIIYVANERLYLRPIGELQAQPILGTELNPRNPTFSPDGTAVAFSTPVDRSLKRIALTGGVPVTISAMELPPHGMTWTNGEILYGDPSSPANRGIVRVAAAGGKPEVIVKIGTDEIAHGPQMLPDGEHVLFTLAQGENGPSRWEKAQIVVQSVRTGERKTLVEAGTDGRFLPTGHLAYALGGVVHAVRLDLAKLEVVGAPVPILEGVRRAPAGATGSAQFAVSASGSLVFIPGPATVGAGKQVFVLLDRTGSAELLKLPPGPYRDPRVSPDGKRLAFGTDDQGEASIWIHELAGLASARRLTVAGRNRHPVWSPDGQHIAFQSDVGGDAAIFRQLADGSGTAERLTKAEPGTKHVPESWSPDGKQLLFTVSKDGATSAMVLALDDRTSTPFAAVRSTRPIGAAFSPDGHWVAYTVHTGRRGPQIFVQPFPPTGATYQVTTAGGHHAFWSRDGSELYYLPGGVQFAAVRVTTTRSFAFTDAVALSRGESPFVDGGAVNTRQNDSLPDKRIVALIHAPETGIGASVASPPELQVVLNWFDDLKARLRP